MLSFCSPLFRELLTISKEHSPIIYLTEVKQDEMESILKFLYLGEVSLQLGKIHEFLSVAASLKSKAKQLATVARAAAPAQPSITLKMDFSNFK